MHRDISVSLAQRPPSSSQVMDEERSMTVTSTNTGTPRRRQARPRKVISASTKIEAPTNRFAKLIHFHVLILR